MLASNKEIEGDNNPKLTGVIALMKATKIAKEACFIVIVFESDSITLNEVVVNEVEESN